MAAPSTDSARGLRLRVTHLALACLLPLTLVACGAQPASRSHWVASGGGGGGAQPTAAPTPSTPSTSTPTPTGPGGGPSSGPSRVPSAKPSTAPSPTGDYLARVPRFDRPPRANRVNLPESGSTPWLTRVPTDQRVAFITIDDGWVKRPEAEELFRRAGVPITLFLTINAIRDNPAYFKSLQGAGAVIEAHTITHTKLAGKSYDFQRREICGSADQLGALYGKRPRLFRPPFGEKDATTMRAAHDCGMSAALFWKETVDKGVVRYQKGNTVQPGDILLLHFRDRFVDDFIATLQAIKAAGLTPALLEDYL